MVKEGTVFVEGKTGKIEAAVEVNLLPKQT
jgi:hypothetical protein